MARILIEYVSANAYEVIGYRDAYAPDLMLNGTLLRDEDGVLPPLDPERIGTKPADVPARAMAFIVYPDADAAACQ